MKNVASGVLNRATDTSASGVCPLTHNGVPFRQVGSLVTGVQTCASGLQNRTSEISHWIIMETSLTNRV